LALGYDRKLYILAFDHRGSFEKLFGVSGRAPTSDEAARISEAKSLIFEGFRRAVAGGIPKEAAGVLVDDQYGPQVARTAREEGYLLAMPAEKSGQAEFDFQHGDAFGAAIEEYDPTFCKVLVRYNPQGDRAVNARQTERLKRLSDWLHERDRKFLFELLVPAEAHQLEAVGGDEDRYDVETRPRLMLAAIEELQDAGVEPDVWKIEGIESREACREIAELVRRGGRAGVSCVVLGRGAADEKVEAWLRAGSGLPGYIGFAIGRSIFGEAVKALAAGSGDREAGVASIAAKYRRFVDVYEGR
jgi:myo-inositol catabolism protein IolC